ncbi:MAG TPA: tryptophan synthase subunit alpha [Nocardioidaceae bacterium]|nr:tryptophan synthase subunit alpha [Nocardioidaceae bacterium]
MSASVRDTIERCRAEGRSALVGYLPAGFPDADGSIAALCAMVDAGVDVLEVGLPYSDPVIDGPVIQRATEAALAGGFRVRDLFGVVEALSTRVPTLVMTYWNPVERLGAEPFATALGDAGGAGLITPDLIPDEAGEWIAASERHRLDRVFLVAPSSTDERIAQTAAASRGFVYAASLMGVTGARAELSAAGAALVKRVRATTDLPVGVGIGVSTADQAAEVAGYADAVIVGSAFVRCLLDAPDRAAGVDAVGALAVDLASGVRRPGTR